MLRQTFAPLLFVGLQSRVMLPKWVRQHTIESRASATAPAMWRCCDDLFRYAVSKVINIALSIHVREWMAMARQQSPLAAMLASSRLKDKSLTCHRPVKAYLERIAACGHNGPALAAVLAPNPNTLAQSDRHDMLKRSCPISWRLSSSSETEVRSPSLGYFVSSLLKRAAG
jgi:hypothetical protein